MRHITFMLLFFAMCSCKEHISEETEPVTVPVTIATINTGAIEDFVDLNGVTMYTINTPIKANATGYVEQVKVTSNDRVKKGQLLFSLKTREAKALGNTINKLDPTLHFGGAIPIRAGATGYIDSVNVNKGDYVQDGDFLGIIHDANSFSVVVNVPYELKNFLPAGRQVTVYLPDGKTVETRVVESTQSVDPATQTQKIRLNLISTIALPANLVVRARIVKQSIVRGISLPKACVLSNEDQSQFWIMALINDSTAVKMPVQKGIETNDKIQILSPKLKATDRILLTGNYGIADTIKVKITH